jgi:hypothetical protein
LGRDPTLVGDLAHSLVAHVLPGLDEVEVSKIIDEHRGIKVKEMASVVETTRSSWARQSPRRTSGRCWATSATPSAV